MRVSCRVSEPCQPACPLPPPTAPTPPQPPLLLITMSKRAITWQHSTSNLILMGKRIVAVCPFNTFINCRLRSNYLQCAIMFFFPEELISNSHRRTLCCFENLSRCRLMKCFIWLKGKVVHSHYFGAEVARRNRRALVEMTARGL